MRGGRLLALAGGIVAAGVLLAGRLHSAGIPAPGRFAEAHRAARIHPDYAGVTIPPNIAPLSFVVDEPGRRCCLRISGPAGEKVDVAGASSLRIPIGPWRRLLRANRGRELSFDLYVADAAGRWTHFDTFHDRVAPEEVDGTLVYRLLQPTYNKWGELGIYQRDLSDYDEKVVLENRALGSGCLNCHTFLNNRPDTFLLQLRPGRGSPPAMLIAQGGSARKVDTTAAGSPSPATYSAWHPSGKLIAFSCNKLRQFFHKAGPEPREVVDLDSGLALYSLESNRGTTDPAINQPGRLETFPAWSRDGKWLYFASAPQVWGKGRAFPPATAMKARYDLVRAHFDIATGKWGAPETLLTARQTGKTLLEPRPSPDGRFLAFCMCDYGSFPILQQHSDLYLMDLEAPGRPIRRLAETPESPRDSWHSWSSNGRWIVFSRKRDYGLFARPYLRYIDEQGNPGKPFVLPQADPTFYDSFAKTYNAPELVSGPIRISPETLARAANGG